LFIDPIPEDEAPETVADMYAVDRSHWGFLPGFTRVFSRHPDAYQAWRQLNVAVRSGMDARRYELVTLAAARTLRSSYCTVAHGSVLKDRYFDSATVLQLMADHHYAGLDQAEVVMMDFAEKVAADATSITADDIDALLKVGLTERDILDVVLAVGARCFFATVVEALDAGPDPEMTSALDTELREALLVGRRPG
jgi:uncharacterized peroxidase-related enzyme